MVFSPATQLYSFYVPVSINYYACAGAFMKGGLHFSSIEKNLDHANLLIKNHPIYIISNVFAMEIFAINGHLMVLISSRQ